MRRAALLVAVAAALGASAPARAETVSIAIPGKYFDPPQSTIVAGDVVVFRNADLVTHDVRISGGVFDSGPIPRFMSWTQRFDRPGLYPFICTLHPFMSGSLDTVAATLAAAPDGVLEGEQLTLSGRAPAGTAWLGIEQSVAGGPWSAVGAGAAPAPDGAFEATVAAVEGARYRVTTPAGAGQVVTPRVTAHVDIGLAVVRKRRSTTLRVRTTPATTGLIATLQLYSRWHFRWRAHRDARLDGAGRASFRLPATRRAYARVVLRRTRRGPVLVRSGAVKLWSGESASDPDAITPEGSFGDMGAHDPQ